MAAICYYGNVMATTRWRLCVTMETLSQHSDNVYFCCWRCVYSACYRCILHLQQYSHRLILFFIHINPTDNPRIFDTNFNIIFAPTCTVFIHKSLRDFRPLLYSSRDGHAEGEHVKRGRDTPSFCPTLQVLDIWLLTAPDKRFSLTLDSLGRWPRPASSFRSVQAATLLEFHVPLTNFFVRRWFCAVHGPKPPLHRHNWLSFAKFQDTERFLIHRARHFSSRLPSSGGTCKYAKAPSTKKRLWEILYLLICSFLPCLSWLLRSRVRKFRRDLWITLYLEGRPVPVPLC